MGVAVANDHTGAGERFPLHHRSDYDPIEAALAFAFFYAVSRECEAVGERLRFVDGARGVEFRAAQTFAAGTEPNRGCPASGGIFCDVVDDSARLGLTVEQGGWTFDGFHPGDRGHVGSGEPTHAVAHGGRTIEAANVHLRHELVEDASGAWDDVDDLVEIKERTVDHELLGDDVDLHGQIADRSIGARGSQSIGCLVAAVVSRDDFERIQDYRFFR